MIRGKMNEDFWRNTKGIIHSVIILLLCIVSIICRLFSVLRFEAIIHEFDPWFNYRSTMFLVEKGWYEFLNWFDEKSWYPLGRVVGGTVFPGIMVTSAIIHYILESVLKLPIAIRHICVFLAPSFSALTALSMYAFVKEVEGSTTSALLGSIFMGIIPGYISRSVAGSYDNEAIAIFLLITTFMFWLKSLRYGSAFYAGVTSFFYFYMASAWGGYVFIINLIPLHVLVLLMMGRYTSRLYTAYSTFYILATISSMTIPFIGVNPTRTSDHIAALGVFGLLQLVMMAYTLQSYIQSPNFKQSMILGFITLCLLALGTILLLATFGIVAPLTDRFYSLWDTDYAKKHIPIVASVSEHQPTPWSSFFFDLQLLMFAFPVGVFLCLKEGKEAGMFVVIYALTASYFAAVMVRLILTLAPIVCAAAAITFGRILDRYLKLEEPLQQISGSSTSSSNILEDVQSFNSSISLNIENKSKKTRTPLAIELKIAVVFTLLMLLFLLVRHCTWVTSNAYSSPSVVLASYDRNGKQVIIDDFREAYYWLRKNTGKDTRILSWWDYGYQIAGFSDRVTIVDNNTWNNTHIATVAKALATPEPIAYEVLKSLDVDYVLVICGVVSGYTGDDINKFLWMIRIAEGVYPNEVQEWKFFTPRGEFRVDENASQAMKDSLMYKMVYHKMSEIMGGNPMDMARGVSLPAKGPELTVLEEAFSSERFMVRIYKVKENPDVLGRSLFDIAEFDKMYR